jgi:PhnB protein
VTTDPFTGLRPVEPGPPDPRFVARLRRRIEEALGRADLPIIDLPERSTPMTDTTTTTAAATPTAIAVITPYLCVRPATEALEWYRQHLDAVETVRYTGDDGRIGHAEVTINGGTVMLSDEYPELDVVSPATLGGTATTLYVEVPDVDAVYVRVLAAGARIAHPPKDEAYGARSFTMLDPFGHRWMIQTPTGSPTIEEVQAQVEGYTITTPPE